MPAFQSTRAATQNLSSHEVDLTFDDSGLFHSPNVQLAGYGAAAVSGTASKPNGLYQPPAAREDGNFRRRGVHDSEMIPGGFRGWRTAPKLEVGESQHPDQRIDSTCRHAVDMGKSEGETTEKQGREGHTSLEEIVQEADSYADALDIEEEEFPTQVAGTLGPAGCVTEDEKTSKDMCEQLTANALSDSEMQLAEPVEMDENQTCARPDGPFAGFEGLQVQKDETVTTLCGDIIGRIIEGDIGKITNLAVDNDGDVIDRYGNVKGKAERWEPQLRPPSLLCGLRLDSEGWARDEHGDAVGKLVRGDLDQCVGKEIGVDDKIVDADGNELGEAQEIRRFIDASTPPPDEKMLPDIAPPSRPPATFSEPLDGHPLSTGYPFVPIPGAQQHERLRMRREKTEGMYKCGRNGRERAHGTLNYRNAHVNLQGHGTTRLSGIPPPPPPPPPPLSIQNRPSALYESSTDYNPSASVADVSAVDELLRRWTTVEV